MPNITIRRMAKGDLEVVCTIEKEVFQDPWSLNAFKTDLSNSMAWPMVAEFENKVVGYSNIYIVAGEVQIGNFAVAPGFRNRGVGKKMMNEIFRKAEENNCRSIFLEVRESNKPAMELYKAFGFIPAGKRKDYYSHPRENAIIMIKDL
ncbi:MAG: ribosomal protein S18-alanine N-acetyltransferase [Candidatus Zixiibacteriota bacterium]|nr:MAG: ribosomal protein S18-alanine N-acetyltransferase [candidate division Zixibacteria bacterium]